MVATSSVKWIGVLLVVCFVGCAPKRQVVWTFDPVSRRTAYGSDTAHLKMLSHLRMLELRAGITHEMCRGFVVQFSSDGRATMESYSGPDCMPDRSLATVPFPKVLGVLRNARVTRIARTYPLRKVMVSEDHLHMIFVDGSTFDADGPRRQNWSPEWQLLTRGIDRLILEARWSPPLPDRLRSGL